VYLELGSLLLRQGQQYLEDIAENAINASLNSLSFGIHFFSDIVSSTLTL
jgi:hypothetical protein